MKKALAIALTLVMTLAATTACGKGGKNDEPANSTQTNTAQSNDAQAKTDAGDASKTEPGAAKTVDYSKHEEFTFWTQGDTNDIYYEYTDNPTMKFVGNKFNVTLKFEHPATGTEVDSLSLMLGTGEYTDVFSLDYFTGSIKDLYKDGVLVNIADYLDYMPNLKARLDGDPYFEKRMRDSEGRILSLRPLASDAELIWGGLVYRRDILEAMTDGNVKFPSGNAEPTTIADWEYMLPLYKDYFEAAGMTEYAPLILPYTGLFAFSELTSGFGGAGTYYVEGDTVKSGPLEDGFYNYLAKMKKWYAKGWIYKDFASRTNDPVYFPNTALTYGGASGIWFGLNSQLGDAMSMPDYGMFFDVQPLKNPLDTEHGVTEAPSFSRIKANEAIAAGYAVTSACKNIPKLLSVLDYLYSDEGGMLYNGITKEQGADTDPICVKAGLQDGIYWFDENGNFVYNPILTAAGGTVDIQPFVNRRLGLFNYSYYDIQNKSERERNADTVWGAYPDAKIKKLPSGLDYGDDEATFANNSTNVQDYLYTAISKFILGTTDLNETTWKDFKDNINKLGGEKNLELTQAAYNRFMGK